MANLYEDTNPQKALEHLQIALALAKTTTDKRSIEKTMARLA